MVTEGLLPWYTANRRDLPWRKSREPYAVWVSEIMLQQTRVEAVIPYYRRFMEALPDVRALADAPEEQLLKLWEGLGYYSRVRNMQAAAGQIVKRGGFPQTAEELKKLKGFGDYTAGAVASIAFAQRAAAVDGNVLRVWTRMERVGESIKIPSVKRACTRAVLEAMPEEADPGQYNQALMELGATVCTPRSPDCAHCPVQAHCGAFAADEAEDYPVKDPKPVKAVEEFDVYLIVKDGRALVRKRPKSGLLAGLWEFPHGKLPVRVKQELPPVDVKHVFTHKIWLMHGLRAELAGETEGCVWVDAQELAALPMPAPMDKYRKELLESGEMKEWKS